MDRLRVITFDRKKRANTLLDINDDVNYALVRDTFAPKPSNRQSQYASSGRRYGGARIVNETHENGVVEAEWYVTGTTTDAALTKLEALLTLMEDASGERWLEWRADGAAQSVFYQLRGPATWEPLYRWVETMQTHTLHVRGSWPIAPLGEGAPMDIYDDYAINTIADYTFDSGGGTLSVSGGQLVPSSTAMKQFYHSERGYGYSDVEVTLKFTTGASTVGLDHNVIKRIDATNLVFARIVPGTLSAGVFDNNAYSTSNTTAQALTANTSYWLRLRTEGNRVFAEIFSKDPTPSSTTNRLSTTNVTLTTVGQQAEFGVTTAGVPALGGVGARLTPAGTDERYDEFNVRAFSYSTKALPDTAHLRGIPGSAPALMDATISTVATGAPLYGFLMGWTPEVPAPFNLLFDGDFESNVTDSRWGVGAVTGVIGAATSIVLDAASAKFGTNSAAVQTPATTDTGASVPIYYRFEAGTTYNVSFWARSAAQTTALRAKLGKNGDIATGTAAALSSTYQQYTVSWTPTADTDLAYVVAGINAATATLFNIDGVTIWEGSSAAPPTSYGQSEGRGAFVPFGVVDFANSVSTSSSLSVNSIFRSGTGVANTAAGSVNDSAFVAIDPSLLTQDLFTQDEVVLEVWAKLVYDTTIVQPILTVSAYPKDGASSYKRYTHEWGNTGKYLQSATFSTQPVLVRCGTLTLPVDINNAGRWIVEFNFQAGAGSSGTYGFDHALFLPARQRASTPSGKIQDSFYPAFISQTANTTESVKTVRHDLSAVTKVGAPSASGKPAYPDVGLGGQLLEVGPGDVDVVTMISNHALDAIPLPASSAWTPNITGSYQFAITPRYFLGRGS